MGRPGFADITRRDGLKAAGLCAAWMAVATGPGDAIAKDAVVQAAVPFSAGVDRPKTGAPPNACDSRILILSTRFPASSHWKGEPVVDSDVAAYRLLQKRIGVSRVVVVTPSTYATDNRATLDGVAQFGPSRRAVVVVDLDISDADLKRMASARRDRGLAEQPGRLNGDGLRSADGLWTRTQGKALATRVCFRLHEPVLKNISAIQPR